jgi:NADH-quinone oxidoreductase subunit I
MTNEFELADQTRESLIYEKKDLLAPLMPGMVEAPHSMVEGMVERDYYLGRIARATDAQIAEVAARAEAHAAQEEAK